MSSLICSPILRALFGCTPILIFDSGRSNYTVSLIRIAARLIDCIAARMMALYPRPMQHRFQTDPDGAEIVCAHVEFGAGSLQPLLQSLPSFIPQKAVGGLGRGVELLFEEAFGDLLGRQAAVDRLVEYVLILDLRHVVERELIECGTLRGLSDERLSKALMAMHQHPEGPWDLDRLADVAGMSRARFAANFRDVVGATPMAYLTNWRMAIVQTMLRMGEPLKSIAPAVGYESSTAH